MRIFKIVGISIFSIFALLYLAFLFVLPKAIDLNKYESEITRIIKQNTGIQAEFESLNLKTSWDLSAGIFTKKADLKYETGEKFAQINNLGVKVSLFHLLFKDIKINKIFAEKVMANFDEAKYKMQNAKGKKNLSTINSFNFSTKMPAIYVKDYRLSLISNSNNYTFKGSGLKIYDFILNKRISVKTNGELILNKRKQISYNIFLISHLFPEEKNKKTKEFFDYIKIFDDLYKYNVNGNISTYLRIFDTSNVDGTIKLDKLTFQLGGKSFPQSHLYLDCKGDKAKIESDFYTDTLSKATITGFLKTGKRKAIDLKIKSDKTDLKNAIFIANNFLKLFGKTYLNEITAQGFLKADFNVRSDFKKVQSSGYLKIENAKLTNSIQNVYMDEINSDIDFSNDTVQIRKADAKLNSQPIKIIGEIDKGANANILIFANNLQLKGVLLSLGKSQILKENNISGVVNINASLKGRLDKAIPKIDVLANNINVKNRNANIKIQKIVLNDQNNSGKADILGVNINQNSAFTASAPKISVNFDNKNLNIIPTYFYINGIKTNLSGKISDLNAKPYLNPININIPNQISIPVKGYANSNMVLKGNIKLTGNLDNPQLQGGLEIPLIKIPTASTALKDTTLQLDKEITLNCPNIKIANSNMNLSAQINKTLPLKAKNVKFSADNFDLNVLIPIFKTLSLNTNSPQSLTVSSGKSHIETFKIGRIVSDSVVSNISFKNNILNLYNIRSNAYFGKIGGDISYDFKNRKTNLKLQGRGLSASPALIALTGRDDDIHGQLDFDSNVSLTGYSKNEILKNLKGNVIFIINNGKMGMLGKFEHLIYAQNIISNNVFRASLNLIVKALTVKNTGVYKYMKGKLSFNNGWVNINQIKTSGPSMSLYITGRYYMQENLANLIMLGRISGDVVRILGPIGDFSVNKAVSSIPKANEINSFFSNQFRTNPVYENISQIPPLTPKTEFPTKEFKVIIDGDIQKQTSVKSFKWLAKPSKTETLPPPVVTQPKQELPDFIEKLPEYKN